WNNAVDSQTLTFRPAKLRKTNSLAPGGKCCAPLSLPALKTPTDGSPIAGQLESYCFLFTTLVDNILIDARPIVAAVVMTSAKMRRACRAPKAGLVTVALLSFVFQLAVPSFAQEARKIRMAYSALSVAFLNVFVARD